MLLHLLLESKDEKEESVLDFYRDKVEIKNEIDSQIKEKGLEIKKEREVNFLNYNSNPRFFINQSYIEFNYLDFGNGIPSKLKDIVSVINVLDDKRLSESFGQSTNLDSKCIEYAFLLETSSNPLENFSNSELVPRGLFFLIDMVRRYQGLMRVRSGRGNIVFDFSNKLTLDPLTNSTRLKSHITVKESINYIETDNFCFDGTMVSIVLPERKEVSSRPARIDNYSTAIFNRNPLLRESLIEELFHTEQDDSQIIIMNFLLNDLINNKNLAANGLKVSPETGQ
jgi:hypothetical protein